MQSRECQSETQICPRNPKYCYSTQHPGPSIPALPKECMELVLRPWLGSDARQTAGAPSGRHCLESCPLSNSLGSQRDRTTGIWGWQQREQRGWEGSATLPRGASLTRLQCIRVGSGTPPWHDRRLLHSGTGISGDNHYRRCPAHSAPHSASPGSPQHSGKPPWWGCTGPHFCTGTGCCSEAPSDHRRRLRLGKETVEGIRVWVWITASSSVPAFLSPWREWLDDPFLTISPLSSTAWVHTYSNTIFHWCSALDHFLSLHSSSIAWGLCSACSLHLECCVWYGQSHWLGEGVSSCGQRGRWLGRWEWSAYAGVLYTSRSLDCI